MRDEPVHEKRVAHGSGCGGVGVGEGVGVGQVSAGPGGHPLPQLTISTVGLTGPPQSASALVPESPARM